MIPMATFFRQNIKHQFHTVLYLMFFMLMIAFVALRAVYLCIFVQKKNAAAVASLAKEANKMD